MRMEMVGISRSRLAEVIPRKVMPDQVAAYWGVNPKERLQRILESALVSYGGAWAAWFLSFMAGGYVSAFLGTFFVFNWMYTPWINAKKRNAKMRPSLGGMDRRETVHYAVFTGRIKQLKKVKRRAGKSIGAVAQEYLLMLVQDDRGRELEVVTQWQPCYRKLRRDMRCHTVVSSLSDSFESVFMIADMWAPACDVWVGDYPYLQKEAFKDALRDIAATNNTGNAKQKQKSNYDDAVAIDVDAVDADGGDLLSKWITRAKVTLDDVAGGLPADFDTAEGGDASSSTSPDYYPSDKRASSRFVKSVSVAGSNSNSNSGGGGGGSRQGERQKSKRQRQGRDRDQRR
jgi:hypothetical protein